MRIERDGAAVRGVTVDQPLEVRLAVTEDLLRAAAGDLANVVVQQLDEATGRWASVPTRVDEATGEIVAETSLLAPVIATVPGPPARAGEALAVVSPERETLLAPPPTSPGDPPPILRVNPGTVDSFATLAYAPRAPQQVPPPNEGEALVGQPFVLEVYKLDQLQLDYAFQAPLDVFIPFTNELLDLVGGDPTVLVLQFFDERADPPQWTELETLVISDGLYVALEHVTTFSLTARAQIVGEDPTRDLGLRRTASLSLSSLYGRSVPLAVGDIVSVGVFADSGGDAVGEFDITLVYPQDILAVTTVDSRGSVCQDTTPATHRLGSVTLRCRVLGAGFVGVGGLVANLTMQATGNGLATVSFHENTRVLSAFDNDEILGFAPPIVLAIGAPIRVFALRLEFHEVHNIDDPDLQVRHVGAKEIDGG